MTRHELKEQLQHDQFTDTVSDVLGFATTHRQQVVRWILIGVAVAVIIAGAFFYMHYTSEQREQDLDAAFAVADRPVGTAAPGANSFASESAKNDAVLKAFASVAAKDNGSDEGYTAEYYVGTLKAKNGDVKGAETALSQVSDSSAPVSALAKIALAQLYVGDNKMSQAQSLLQSLIDKPSDLVSKAQAEILLARMLEKTNPQQAKKLLHTVQTESKDPVVSRSAQELASELAK